MQNLNRNTLENWKHSLENNEIKYPLKKLFINNKHDISMVKQ